MKEYKEIMQLIEQAEDIVEFADYGDGISEEWIEKAEKRLRIKLPESYKWWLKNYSGGEIAGEEVFSVYEQDFDTVVGGDIVYMYEQNKKLYDFPDYVLAVCENEEDIYYFDTSEIKVNNEYAIYTVNTSELYANNFLDFLKKKIEEYL